MITIATDQKRWSPSPDICETSGDNAANHQSDEVQAAAQPNLWRRIEVIKIWSWSGKIRSWSTQPLEKMGLIIKIWEEGLDHQAISDQANLVLFCAHKMPFCDCWVFHFKVEPREAGGTRTVNLYQLSVMSSKQLQVLFFRCLHISYHFMLWKEGTRLFSWKG